MTRNWSNQNPNYLNSQKYKGTKHIVNRVSSSLPKGGHSATQTELKLIETHIR